MALGFFRGRGANSSGFSNPSRGQSRGFFDPRAGRSSAGAGRFSDPRGQGTPSRGGEASPGPAGYSDRWQMENSLREGKQSFNYAARHKALMNEHAQKKAELTKKMESYRDKLGKRWVSAELERRPEYASRETERLRQELLERMESTDRGRQQRAHKEMVQQHQADVEKQWDIQKLEAQVEKHEEDPKQKRRAEQNLKFAQRQVARKLLLYNKRQPYALREFERHSNRDELLAKQEYEKGLAAIDRDLKTGLVELDREKSEMYRQGSHDAQDNLRGSETPYNRAA